MLRSPGRQVRMLAGLTVAAVALAATATTAGCDAGDRRQADSASQKGLPAVSKVTGAGGSFGIAQADGRTLVVTQGGVVGVVGGRAKTVAKIPEGHRLIPWAVSGRWALLTTEKADIAVWEVASPAAGLRRIRPAHPVVAYALVDLLGDAGVPEVVLVTSEQWQNTGTPVDAHERLEIWSFEGEKPERLFLGDFVEEGKASLIGDVYFADVGRGDKRPELVFSQHEAVRVKGGHTHMVLVSPSEDFAALESDESGPSDLSTGIGTAITQTERGIRVLLSSAASEPKRGAEIDVTADGFGPVAQDSEVKAEQPPVPSTHRPQYSLGRMHEQATRGVVLGGRDRFEAGVEASFADGSSVALTPRGKIRHFPGVGLGDLDGDGQSELVIMGDGDPGICNDTYTAYIGWANREQDGGLGKIDWSKSLGGGFGDVTIVDLDGDGDDEVVAGIVDTHCSGTPVALWIFNPDAAMR